ncbi:MAG: sporulation protein YunB [Clostridia bacterium]|nr:sporulation protein YunB [Clostridia bacterium]MDD4048132.1 sporulation protein YunB [Clostridia bacterium]
MSKLARWYRTKYGLKRGIIKIPRLLIISIVIGVISLYLFKIVDNNLKPTIMDIAESKAHIIATEAINNALYDKVFNNIGYEDLIIVHKDSQQHITMIQANTIKMSKMVAQTNLIIKEALKNLEYEKFNIPVGQALGSPLLAHYGPKVNVKIIPVGTVNVCFDDKFQEAGINQVRHILYMNIEANIKIVVPLVTKNVIVKSNIPIAETVVVGQVPNMYFGMDSPLKMKGLGNDRG